MPCQPSFSRYVLHDGAATQNNERYSHNSPVFGNSLTGLSIRNLALITSRLSSWCSSGGNEVIDNEVFIIFEPTPTTPSRLPPTPLTTSFIISTLCLFV
uniref:Uncharacterized protein n=1 Tax=Glossina palpalis gambiensis TaxID=67801 RepID=A0A1B0B9C2_9MUSC